ncbi:AbrB family transcriptional regulator [Candidatus Cyanaurora vandensis]|uniref:AbrB family transcriptional regulator n=1 Tax=Candidatus Cyanaurora vandensis TaxID=2714958 RepID=UPI00257F9BED|nr:AbrB family transcriptional regulator [Candidatus Cyanaurora vandensis]
MPNAQEVLSSPLQGEALVAKFKELTAQGLDKKDVAIACGYIRGGRGGKTGNIVALQTALLEAVQPKMFGNKSIKARPTKQRGGRIANYRIQVQQNGNLLIGGAYTRRMGFQPGSEFEIQLGRKHIKLLQVKSTGEVETDDDE